MGWPSRGTCGAGRASVDTVKGTRADSSASASDGAAAADSRVGALVAAVPLGAAESAQQHPCHAPGAYGAVLTGHRDLQGAAPAGAAAASGRDANVLST